MNRPSRWTPFVLLLLFALPAFAQEAPPPPSDAPAPSEDAEPSEDAKPSEDDAPAPEEDADPAGEAAGDEPSTPAEEDAPSPEPAPGGDLDPPTREGSESPSLLPPLQGNLRELESWIVLEEEIAPDPPHLRLEFGFLGVLEARSRIRVDRGGLRGTRLEDLETQQGLESGGIGPWLTFSLGGKVRGGGDVLQFVRSGQFTRQDEEVVFDGVRLAGPGDFVRSRFEFLSLAAFVEWDVLYGQTYRIGLLGGLRYFRLDFDLEGATARPRPQTLKRRVRGELLSPTFGGLIELTPFPYLSVFSQALFMNWSWETVGLEEARYFEFKLGARLNVIPGLLSFSLEYRFLIVNAIPTLGSTGGRIEGALAANGLAFGVGLEF